MDYLKDRLEYNPETGIIINKKNGKVAGTIHHKGYIKILCNKKFYLGHRVAWYLFYGKFPELQVDHINGVKTDNRIINLREVTQRQNLSNCNRHRLGKVVGTSFCKKYKKWSAQIQINKKSINLGRFNTEEEARQVYLRALENWKLLSNEL